MELNWPLEVFMLTPRIPSGARQFEITCNTNNVRYYDFYTDQRVTLERVPRPTRAELLADSFKNLCGRAVYKKITAWNHLTQSYEKAFARINTAAYRHLLPAAQNRFTETSRSYTREMRQLEPIIQRKIAELSSIPNTELSPLQIQKIVGFIEVNKYLIFETQHSTDQFIRRCDILPRSLKIGSDGEIYILSKKHMDGSKGVGEGAYKTVTKAVAYKAHQLFVSAVTKFEETARPSFNVTAQFEAMVGERLRGKPHTAQYCDVAYYKRATTDPVTFEVKKTEKQSILMPYYPGGSVFDRIHNKNLTNKERFRLAAGLLKGLAAIHEAGIIHRDIKPENAWIDKNGEAVIGDFGLATDAHDLARIKEAAGSPYYAAPEVWDFIEMEKIGDAFMANMYLATIGPKVDVYAMGLTLGALIFDMYPGIDPDTGGQNDLFHLMPKPPEDSVDYIVWAMTRPNPAKRITSQQAFELFDNLVVL